VLSRWGACSENPARLVHELIEVARPVQHLVDEPAVQQVIPQALVEPGAKAPLQCHSQRGVSHHATVAR
jgi:hypothetical protein